MHEHYFTSSTSSSSHMTNKVVFVGDAGVGKTTLIDALALVCAPSDGDDVAATRELLAARTSTIGVEFRRVDIGATQCACLWDTAGQERFAPLARVYLRCASVIVLVYNVATPRIDVLATRWYASVVRRELAAAIAEERSAPVLVVVGAQRDRVASSSIDDGDARAFAATIGAEHVVVSVRALDSFRRALVPALVRALERAPPTPPRRELTTTTSRCC